MKLTNKRKGKQRPYNWKGEPKTEIWIWSPADIVKLEEKVKQIQDGREKGIVATGEK